MHTPSCPCSARAFNQFAKFIGEQSRASARSLYVKCAASLLVLPAAVPNLLLSWLLPKVTCCPWAEAWQPVPAGILASATLPWLR